MVIKVTEWWHEGLGWQWETDQEAIKKAQEDLDKILEIIKERKEKNIFWSPVSFSKNIR